MMMRLMVSIYFRGEFSRTKIKLGSNFKDEEYKLLWIFYIFFLSERGRPSILLEGRPSKYQDEWRPSLMYNQLLQQSKTQSLSVTGRGGQKTVKPDPPDQSGRLARLPARPLAYIRTDTDTDILNIRITDG